MPPRHPRLRRAAQILLWIMACCWLGFAGWRLFGVELAWPFVVAMAFTPQVTAAIAVPLLLALLLRSLRAATVLVVALCALVTVMVPRAFPDSMHDPDGPKLRVLTVNLLGGGADLDTVVSLVRDNDIDVLSVQELTPECVAALDAAGLGELLPHHELKPERSAAGTGIYSRHVLTTDPQLSTDGRFWMPAVSVDVPKAEQPVEFLAVHPAAPVEPDHFGDWRRDLAALPPAPERNKPRVLAGDFNATLDHAALRRLLNTGYSDAADATGAGLTGTWPMDKPIMPKITLDHVLVNDQSRVHSYAVHDVPGSDHRAVSAELTLSTPEG